MQNQPNQESQTPRDRSSQSSESSVAQKAERAAMQAKSAAVERVGAARQEAVSELGRGRTAIVSRVRGVSTALRSAGDKLKEDDDVVSRYANTASERIESIASYIDSAEPREMVRDAEDLARSHPAWFFGGAFILGLAAGRFLKASAEPGVSSGVSTGPARRPPPPRRYSGSSSYGDTTQRYRSQSAASSSSVGVSPTIDVPGSGGMNPSPGTTQSGSASSSNPSGFNPGTSGRP